MREKEKIEINEFLNSLECCDEEKLYDQDWFKNMLFVLKKKIG